MKPLLIAFLALPLVAMAQDASPPNIVFILADDLGYGELGAYGQEKIKTPNIDRLRSPERCMRFLQHYTGAPVCAPARCVFDDRHSTSRHAEIRSNRDSGNGTNLSRSVPDSPSEVVTI